ncbi:MAG: Flp pilus assembly complex ATPase component TadA [Rickettsiales bacterium]|jgi:type II secretory ATPase GspE/PulE/Tfp pilus assembly ATPase PilB-like protein|nr:Flp pilus assembly complex ATPase component TadA [Rickettsiales bacterium]
MSDEEKKEVAGPAVPDAAPVGPAAEADGGDSSAPVSSRFEGLTNKEIIAKLYQGGGLESAASGNYPVGADTQSLLALFGDGTFIVSNTHKYDGRVLSFQSLVRKKGGKINRPEYVPMSLLAQVYAQAGKDNGLHGGKAANIDEADNNKMQKDFVDIVYRAAEQKVSDIHVVVAEHTTVMFRVAGSMHTILEYDKVWGESFVRSVFASADISDSNYAQNEFQVGQKLGNTPLRGEKDLYLPENVLAIRLQFNPIAFATRYLVMRVLYANSNAAQDDDLHGLGFGDYEDTRLFRMRAYPTGLCVIAGPTGSGKSTTLQRNMIKMLKEKNYEINLITVEDPPEYPIPGGRQLPVTNAATEQEKEDAFNLALAAALRSDPDAMMVGEVRTLSAADLVFKAALSGHNVWTTLHANSAPAILNRLMDMGVEAYKLRDPELVRGLLSQRLFKKLCPKCRVPVKSRPGDPAYKRLESALGAYGVEQSFQQGPGCAFCNNKGIMGRIVASEIIMPDHEFLDMLMDGDKKDAIGHWLDKLDGRTLKEDAIEKMLLGVIAVDEVERWCGFLDADAIY